MIYETPEKITEQNSETVKKDIEELVEKNNNIVLDMKNTMYISSAALRVFLMSWKILKIKGYNLSIINANGYTRKILDATGFNKLFADNNKTK